MLQAKAPYPLLIHRRQLLVAAGAGAVFLGTPALAEKQSRDAVVLSLAKLVEREYPDPVLAAAMAANLRQGLRARRYAMPDPRAFAERLTTDLRAVGRDEHLKVTYDPAQADRRMAVTAAPAPPKATPKEPSVRARAIFAPEGYGIVKAELLAGNIGLLRIDNFVPLYDLVRQRLGAAFTLLGDSWGLILDLRNNGGGTSDTPAHLISYLFDRPPFVLNRMIWRNQPEDRIETTRDLAGKPYGERRPVIVATSHSTFSAAEAVAYSLQSTKRATIVGEITRGGANPGDFFNLGGGFEAFCPQGQAVDSVTGKNWEGVGVQPDVRTAPADTLRTAHRIAVEHALAATSDGDTIETLRDALKSGPYPE